MANNLRHGVQLFTLALALALAACGGDGGDGAEAPAPTYEGAVYAGTNNNGPGGTGSSALAAGRMASSSRSTCMKRAASGAPAFRPRRPA
jgi:hypothetical protein